jgi:hypothetical protein
MKLTKKDFQFFLSSLPPFEAVYTRVEKYAYSYELSEFIELIKLHNDVLTELGCTRTSIGVNNDEYFSIRGSRPATVEEMTTKEDETRNKEAIKREGLRDELVSCQNRIEDIIRELDKA